MTVPIQTASPPIVVQGPPQIPVISNQVIQGPTYIGSPMSGPNNLAPINYGRTFQIPTSPTLPIQTATTLPPPDPYARFPKGDRY